MASCHNEDLYQSYHQARASHMALAPARITFRCLESAVIEPHLTVAVNAEPISQVCGAMQGFCLVSIQFTSSL